MKKFAIIFLIVISVTCCWSCDTESPPAYENYIAASLNSPYPLTSEIDFWDGADYMVKEEMPDMTCTFEGVTYSGEYSFSDIVVGTPYIVDYYFTEDSVEFGIKRDTGEFVYINLMNREFFDTEPFLPDVADPYSSALAIADEYAQKHFGDIPEYERNVLTPLVSTNEKDGVEYQITYYDIMYNKRVNGYLSYDELYVRVTSKGHLAILNTKCTDMLDDFSFSVDEKLLNESIFDKVEKSYKKKNIKVTKQGIESQLLTITPKGELCLLSIVNATIDRVGEDFISDVPILTIIPTVQKTE